MDEGLKNKAYLEGQKLKKAGYDNEVILARLDKQGIPEDLALQVVKNLSIQHRVEVVKEQTPVYNIALIRIGIGIALAIVSYFVIPGTNNIADRIDTGRYCVRRDRQKQNEGGIEIKFEALLLS